MSETKFTKGPWAITEWNSKHSKGITAVGGESICYTHNWLASDPVEESSANAYLIASAPEMYEQLEAIKRISPLWLVGEAKNESEAEEAIVLAKMYNGIDEVLAKARGEQS